MENLRKELESARSTKRRSKVPRNIPIMPNLSDSHEDSSESDEEQDDQEEAEE